MKFSKKVQFCHKIDIVDALKKPIFHKMTFSDIVQEALNESVVELSHKKKPNFKFKIFVKFYSRE